MKKIAFCFFTYDNLNHLDIWEKFFAQADPDQYAIYVHASNRNAVSQELLKNNLVAENAYGSRNNFIEYVRCYLKIFRLAFDDPDIYKTVNLTQSCIPIQPFQRVYNDLTQHAKGMMDYFYPKICPDQTYLHRHNALKDKNFVSREDWVAHMGHGIVFSKELANFFSIHDHTDLFEHMTGQDEHYIGNTLIHYGRLDLIEQRHVHRNHLTGGGAHGGMHSLSEDFIRQMRQERNGTTLFIRKVAPGASIPDMCIQ